MENKTDLGYDVWFTSDLHIHHKNVIKHCPERANVGQFDIDNIESHDKWIIDTWNKTVKKKDIVYILGDFSFANTEWTKKILGKLNGMKFLILGNHDKSSEKLDGYFKQITQMKMVTFKKDHYEFLQEDFNVFMCHYAMVVWPQNHYGAVQCCGHSHGRLDDYNEESTDLRVDVGWDSKLGGYNLVSLEKLYKYFKNKTNGETFMKYSCDKKNEKEMII